MKKTLTIEAPKWSKIICPNFVPLTKCRDKHLICYGSRGSGKSYFATEVLVDRAIGWTNYTCLVLRRENNKHEGSTFKLLRETINKNGLTQFFTFKTHPYCSIKCKLNNNEFVFRGYNQPDDIEMIKGIEGLGAIWFEEELPDNEFDFTTIELTVRNNKVKFIQFIYTINPTIADHQNHWFWKKWFLDENGNEESELSFRKKLETIGSNGEIIEEYGTVNHSTYLTNKWLDKNVRNSIELLKLKDPYTYTTQCLGRWSAKVPGGRFWKLFDLSKNSCKKCDYNPNLPIHASFDFNKNPGMHVGIYQIDGYKVMQIDEISLRSPNNRTTDACQTFIKRYENHEAGVYVYGDPNGYREGSSTQAGHNDFALIFDMFARYRPYDRTIKKAPPVAKSGEWLNEIFFSNLDGIELIIPESCKESFADMIYTQEAPDGTVYKPKVRPDKNESSYEKYGHFSDLLRYFMTVAFSYEFDQFKNPGKTEIIMGARKFKDDVY